MRNNYSVVDMQIVKEHKSIGNVSVNVYDYGYKVSVHFFEIPGYKDIKYFSDKIKAINYGKSLKEKYER